MVVKDLVKIDESMVEIEALQKRYDELVGTSKESVSDRKLEAKFIHDRILKLSLNVKNILSALEKDRLK